MHGKIMIFGGYLEKDVSFQWDFELLNFELCGQSYDPFTEAYAKYIETGSIIEQWSLRKNWYWLAHWKFVIFGVWIDQWVIFNMNFESP